ncbi:MAG TPA: GNAT family N-acetyltransferase, partial [Actinomycetota bacterium]|nr:GNAT family N-acetyltransferase [Actinomycetota bacterium]
IFSREEVVRYLYEGPHDEDEVQRRLDLKITQRSIERPGDILRLAVLSKANGRVIGDVVLHWMDDEHRSAEVGFALHPDHQGKGYTTEAVQVLLRVAFEVLGLHRVFGRTEARNVASARVMEKLGMRQEAHFVENEFVKDEWQSELVYAILDREWEARPKRKPSTRTRSAAKARR